MDPATYQAYSFVGVLLVVGAALLLAAIVAAPYVFTVYALRRTWRELASIRRALDERQASDPHLFRGPRRL